jgi:hypothetical protein
MHLVTSVPGQPSTGWRKQDILRIRRTLLILCLSNILLIWLKVIRMCGRKVTEIVFMWRWSAVAMDRGPDECVSGCISSPATGSWGTQLKFSSCNPCHQNLCSELISFYAATLFDCLMLKKKGLRSFKTLVTIYQLTWCNIPKDSNLQQHFCENLKSNSWLIQTCYLFMTDVFLFHSAP